MKRKVVFFLTVMLIWVTGCVNQTNDSKKAKSIGDNSINEIMNKYDPQLSVKQESYRLWVAAESQKMDSYFEASSVGNISNINRNINHLMSAQDTIRTYMLYFGYKSSEYGVELIRLIKEEDAKEKFHVKWRTYQEGVAEVMNYDLEIINQFIEALVFLKDNNSKYEVENGFIYFKDDASLNAYQNHMSVISEPHLQMDQQNIRSSTVHTFIEAIDIVIYNLYLKTEIDKKLSGLNINNLKSQQAIYSVDNNIEKEYSTLVNYKDISFSLPENWNYKPQEIETDFSFQISCWEKGGSDSFVFQWLENELDLEEYLEIMKESLKEQVLFKNAIFEENKEGNLQNNKTLYSNFTRDLLVFECAGRLITFNNNGKTFLILYEYR